MGFEPMMRILQILAPTKRIIIRLLTSSEKGSYLLSIEFSEGPLSASLTKSK
jgi:hypothetical protein